MFKTRLFFSLIFLIISTYLYSQNKDLKKPTNPSASHKKAEYEANIVVFKIKKDFKNDFASKGQKFHFLNSKIEQWEKITSIEIMYPSATVPHKTHNRLDQPLVDLSLIYQLKYAGDLPIEKMINTIKETELVEYAEPKYINKPLFIPNDPYAQIGGNQELYFNFMRTYEAFDVEQGDTNVVIGIIDTGIQWSHEDLINSIKYNYADPIDGIDNDADGYKDNFRGWDFKGTSGTSDNDTYPPTGNDHGTVVAGCAGATTNNGLGVSGTGYKCKILPLKASLDDGISVDSGYKAIVYAANHNCSVINLSWGGVGYSSMAQDVINYAAINHDIVVVASAGNESIEEFSYPSSYENVLSVAAIDTMYHAVLDSFVEIPAYFVTYNYNVDVCAMGRRVASTVNNGYSPSAGGSSFSSPIVAGAAALLRSKYPSLNALQIAELLRVTADPLIDTIAQNIEFKNGKLGKGRINMYKSLTDNVLPSIRMYQKNYTNNFGKNSLSGDTVKITCDFRNFLQPTNNAIVSLSTTNPDITIVKGSNSFGNIPTLGTVNNSNDPFIIVIDPQANLNGKIIFRLDYSDPLTGYYDYQYFEDFIASYFVDIDTNKIHVTITENGRFGFEDVQSVIGNGLTYNNQSILYEGGLMIGSGISKVSDCVRGDFGEIDLDFSRIGSVKYTPSLEGDQEATVILEDTSSANPIGVIVKQRSYAHYNTPNDKFVITEYDITNISGSTLNSLYVGLYNDWDIQNASQNKTNWNAQDSIGYTYYTGINGIYAGICLLTNNIPSCFSMDHVNIGGNNINPNAGFSTAQKYTTLSSGLARPIAGGSGSGRDVSQVVGGALFNILNNEKRTIAFAYVVGDNLTDLKANARTAKNLFKSFNTSNNPSVSDFYYCKKDTATVIITPGNGTKFNFYNSPNGTIPVTTGSSYTLNDIFNSDTIYIRGTDSLFESNSVLSKIIFRSGVKADFTVTPNPLNLNISTSVNFIDNSSNASQINWDLGDGNFISNTPAFMHDYYSIGTYKVTMEAIDIYGCWDTLSKNIVVVNTTGATPFSSTQDEIILYPIPATDFLNISFIYTSPENIKLKVYNALGEQIFTDSYTNVTSKKLQLETKGWKPGIYYAQFQIADKIVTRAVIIQ